MNAYDSEWINRFASEFDVMRCISVLGAKYMVYRNKHGLFLSPTYDSDHVGLYSVSRDRLSLTSDSSNRDLSMRIERVMKELSTRVNPLFVQNRLKDSDVYHYEMVGVEVETGRLLRATDETVLSRGNFFLCPKTLYKAASQGDWVRISYVLEIDTVIVENSEGNIAILECTNRFKYAFDAAAFNELEKTDCYKIW